MEEGRGGKMNVNAWTIDIAKWKEMLSEVFRIQDLGVRVQMYDTFRFVNTLLIHRGQEFLSQIYDFVLNPLVRSCNMKSYTVTKQGGQNNRNVKLKWINYAN